MVSRLLMDRERAPSSQTPFSRVSTTEEYQRGRRARGRE